MNDTDIARLASEYIAEDWTPDRYYRDMNLIAFGNALLEHGYAEGRKDEAKAIPHRGYVLFGAGAYLLAICKGDERGPELVAYLATEEEKVGRTVGDLGNTVPDKEIPLERVAVRLQFYSEAGLAALEQQLRMVRDEHFPPA